MIQAQILRLIERLVADQGIGLLMISHDLAVLADTCDRLAVMYAGRIVEEGPARDVYDAAAHPYGRALSAAFPRIGDPASRRAPRGLPGDPPDPSALPPGCAFHPRCPVAPASARTRTSRCAPRARTAGPPAYKSGAAGGEHRDDHPGVRRCSRQRTARHLPRPARRAARPRRRRRRLDIGPGEIVALVGESGCGKTTLARALLGLVAPTAGRVGFAGEPLGYRPRALKAYRRRVQLVLQDPSGSLNPRHTVYDAVAEGLRIHGCAGDERELVAQALSRAGLRPPERFFLRYPHELSGGQRQRVVIAGALVLHPELLVADEPVASLDASVRGEILALLLRLRDELGLSALVVTHDLGLAWNIADRVAVMYLGRIVETGPVEDVLTAPRHPYTRALLSVLPESPADPVVLTGEPPDPARVPAGCRFHARCQILASGEAARTGVADRCRTHDLPVLPGGTGPEGGLPLGGGGQERLSALRAPASAGVSRTNWVAQVAPTHHATHGGNERARRRAGGRRACRSPGPRCPDPRRA